MRRSAGVEAVVEPLYDVMRSADRQGAEELLSAELTVAIGTDEEEWEADHDAAVADSQLFEVDIDAGELMLH